MSCSNNTNQNNQLFGGLKMPSLNGGSNMLKGSEYESSGSPSVVPQSGSSYYTHDMNNGTKDYAGSYAPVVSQSQQCGGKRKTRKSSKSKKNLQISHSDFENVYSTSLRRKRSKNTRSQSNKRNNRSQSNKRNNRSQSNKRNNRSQSNRRNNRTRSRSNRRKN